jgi:hypothetical protein
MPTKTHVKTKKSEQMFEHLFHLGQNFRAIIISW